MIQELMIETQNFLFHIAVIYIRFNFIHRTYSKAESIDKHPCHIHKCFFLIIFFQKFVHFSFFDEIEMFSKSNFFKR